MNKDAQPYVLMNVHPDRTNSVTFRVLNSFGSHALGAIVTATRGNQTVKKPVQSAWSYMAANDPRVHIGLGDNETVENVSVRWIDGSTTNFGSFKKGFHTLQK